MVQAHPIQTLPLCLSKCLLLVIFRRRGRGRGRGRPERGHHERPNRRDEAIEQPEPSQGRPKRERALPSRVIQIGQAEELTEDDIRSALEVFGEIR